MVHFGRHIIDPKTGLCEICDRGVIHDLRHGKRTGRRFLYNNQDGKFTYRSHDDENYTYEEQRPRYVRKPLYPEPPPSIRTRAPAREPSPEEDHQPPGPRPTTFYYVDNRGQMYPRNDGPPDEPPRRYVVQNQTSPATRPARDTHRRAQTPPPPVARAPQRRAQTPPPPVARAPQRRVQTPPPSNDRWNSQPKRRNNYDTQHYEQPQRTNPYDSYDNYSSKAEMYYLNAPANNNTFTTISSIVSPKVNQHSTSPKTNYQNETQRKQRSNEPVHRQRYDEPEQYNRKVYRKIPEGRYESLEDDYFPNGNHTRPTRRVEKAQPTPRRYESLPQLSQRNARSPLQSSYPSVYYIQATNGY